MLRALLGLVVVVPTLEGPVRSKRTKSQSGKKTRVKGLEHAPQLVGRSALVGLLLGLAKPTQLVGVLSKVLVNAAVLELLPLALGPEFVCHLAERGRGGAEGRLGRLERLLSLVQGVSRSGGS